MKEYILLEASSRLKKFYTVKYVMLLLEDYYSLGLIQPGIEVVRVLPTEDSSLQALDKFEDLGLVDRHETLNVSKEMYLKYF